MKRTKRQRKTYDVSIIMPMMNSQSTVTLALDSLRKQTKSIREVVVVDNASSDESLVIVEKYRKKYKELSITILKNKTNIGVGASYNRGVKRAKSKFVVLMHSDSVLESKHELSRLIAPFQNDSAVVATFSTILQPREIWEKYNFWQKCQFSHAVGKESPGMNTKLDCIKRKVFLELGGFNAKQFGHNILVGSEDADLHVRLKSMGKVVLSSARVVHLHYMSQDYSLSDWIIMRKLMARSYGRFLRIQGGALSQGEWKLMIKPLLASVAIMPFMFPFSFLLLFIFSVVYMKEMYVWSVRNFDYRILLLPGITIFLVFYETFWMIESFLFLEKM